MSNYPKVSVIIPTYNRLSFLKEALNSVIAQTYANWECIVVDDGSNDGTIDTLKLLCQKDCRIKLLQRINSHKGASICRNEGIMATTGNYIIFLDSDDCLAPFCLRNRVEIMENEKHLDLGVFPCQLFKEKPGDVSLLWNANKSESDIDRFLKLDVPWQTSSPIWKKESLLNIGLWDEELLSAQDWEIHLRAIIQDLIYQKFDSPPDCFWRMPREDTIGSKSVSSDYLYSREYLLIKIENMLGEHNLMTQTRKKLMADLYFWLAERWVLLNVKKEALRIWSICWERQLINQFEYQLLRSYFTFNNRLLLKIIKRIESLNAKLLGKKKTFRRTPLFQIKTGTPNF